MLHLTYTGYLAGRPFCECDKAVRREAGDTFAHVPYSHVGEFFERVQAELCPACKAEWDAADPNLDTNPIDGGI